MQRCHNLISWKHSFKRLNEEYEMAKKKKQALDNFLSVGRISQSTYDSFDKEIQEAIAETEAATGSAGENECKNGGT